MPKRVCVVLTTRGNYAKMKSTMRAVQRHSGLALQMVVAGGILLPRYGDHARRIEADGFRIDRRVHFLVEGDDLSAMTTSAGLATIEVGHALEELRPDVVVVIADRYEALSIALAAICLNIPIAHLEGGEVSGSIDESLRHAITKLAHLHFPANHDAADRLRRMGEANDAIFVTGTPSLDLLAELDLGDLSVLESAQKKSGEGESVDFLSDYIVVSQHPVVTEYEEALRQIEETALAVETTELPAVWVWPNMDAGSEQIREAVRQFCAAHRGMQHFSALPFEAYAVLLKNARCLLGNSSSGIRECAFIGVPVVNVGTRQAGRARGINVLDVPYERAAILTGIHRQLAHGPYPPDFLYGDGRAGERIAGILATYEFRRQKRIVY